LAGILLTVTVVGSEIASRILRLVVCDGRGSLSFVMQPDYGWTHAANTRAESHGCLGRRYEFRAEVQTNSKGLCSHEYSYERTPGRPRALVLGDSITEGSQLSAEQVFTALLETRLASGGTPPEIINAGHSGFGTDNELLFFRAEGRKYAPDVVVVAFNVQNDVAENSPTLHDEVGLALLPKAGIELDPSGRVLFDPSPFRRAVAANSQHGSEDNAVVSWLCKQLYLFRWVHRHLTSSADTSAELDLPKAYALQIAASGVFTNPPLPPWDYAWRITEALYRELHEDVRALGATLLVVFVPERQMVVPDYWHALTERLPSEDRARWDVEYPRRRMKTFGSSDESVGE